MRKLLLTVLVCACMAVFSGCQTVQDKAPVSSGNTETMGNDGRPLAEPEPMKANDETRGNSGRSLAQPKPVDAGYEIMGDNGAPMEDAELMGSNAPVMGGNKKPLPKHMAKRADSDTGKIAVLILTGAGGHAWEEAVPTLQAILQQTGRFEVDRIDGPERSGNAGEISPEWLKWQPPPFSDYDVVISHYEEQWPDAVAESLVEFVRAGGGIVSIHQQISAVPNRDLIGIAWAESSTGYKLHVNDDTGEVVYLPPHHGPGPGHGRQHEFLVKTRQPDHPVMKGLPKEWLHGKDELYHGFRGPAGNLTVLATAFSDTAQWGTGFHEPVVWTVDFGEGRAFLTVLGHRFWSGYEYDPSHGIIDPGENGTDALYCVGFQTIFARGTEWAATGKVTIPIPKEFPTEAKTSLVEPGKMSWERKNSYDR